ncbi:hypothetical protein RUM44_010835 [Polyplax serrata]|uniref:Uncharacterized protein n=1 Tax=Polyplax serrata TaxID=468196 RepID=A0ABR1ANA7_POLSC
MSKQGSFEDSEKLEQNRGNRPVSRRGSKATTRQNPVEDNNMQTGRPPTDKPGMRPPSTQSLSKRTASRLSTGVLQPPKAGQSVIGISNINVLDRPITQQGVTGLRTATSRGPQFRQVLDKRYYEGLIRMKMKDIVTEIERLNGEIDLEMQQHATSQIYEKRVREVAAELTKLQGQLADYNVVIDKVNTSTEKSQIDMETEELKHDNSRRMADLDELFGQSRLKEEQIYQLETEIQNEKDVTLKLIQDMNETDRNKYEELKTTNEELQAEIEQYQQQLDVLTNQKLEFEDRISGSQIKQETVRLYHKLREREERKATLLEEERNRSTPAQEREKLLQKVKEDNAEMAAIDRQINQVNEQIKKRKEELEMIERDLEESTSDRHQKFKELKKREETMEQFLSTFEESRTNESLKIEELEKKIVIALQQMSKNLTGGGHLPSRDEFYLLKENLTLKEEELKKSKLTVDELGKKREQFAANLKKVDDLEKKIQEEILTIQEKTTVMTEDLKVFSDLDSLRLKAKEKRENLAREKDELTSKRNALHKTKADLQSQNQKLTKELNENETYVQLNNLEKKLQLLEQNNISMREYIESKKVEMEYEPVKATALQMVNEYNQLLIDNLVK